MWVGREEERSPTDVVVERDARIAELEAELGRLRHQLEAERRHLELYKELAYRDGLTGLHNRRYFEERIVEELSRAERTNERLALIILDLDDFKKINDLAGHSAGDEVLRRIASVLLEERRTMDVACRLGGDEFAVLLPSTDAEGAKTFIARLRARLKKGAGARALAHDVEVRVSTGFAVYPRDAQTGAQLVALADAGMYMEKEERKRAAA